MPYCEPCEKYHTPSTVREDGTCPECGNPVEVPAVEDEDSGGAPWHLKLLIMVLVAYLAFRTVQMISWLF